MPLLVLLLASFAVGAAEPAATGPETWNVRLQESERLLVAGEYAAAYEVTGPLLAEVGGQLLASKKSDRVLGSLFALQALAEAGTGREELAAWHWSVARSLKPNLEATSLERYGEAGERIAGYAQRSANECEGMTFGELRATADGKVEPPRKIESPWPQYTDEMRRVGIEGRVILRAFIDLEGQMRCPVLIDFDQPSFAYVVTETLPRWEFEPARVDGKPTPVLYDLTFNFTLDRR